MKKKNVNVGDYVVLKARLTKQNPVYKDRIVKVSQIGDGDLFGGTVVRGHKSGVVSSSFVLDAFRKSQLRDTRKGDVINLLGNEYRIDRFDEQGGVWGTPKPTPERGIRRRVIIARMSEDAKHPIKFVRLAEETFNATGEVTAVFSPIEHPEPKEQIEPAKGPINPVVVDAVIDLPKPFLDWYHQEVPHGQRTVLDRCAVSRFGNRMHSKMERAAELGRHGWDDPRLCPMSDLERMFQEQLNRPARDYVDIANFAMMLYFRKEATNYD